MDFDLLVDTRRRFEEVPDDLVAAGTPEKQRDGSTWYKLRIDCKDPETEARVLKALSRKMGLGTVGRYACANTRSCVIVRVSPGSLFTR